jgi:hypothetical protein
LALLLKGLDTNSRQCEEIAKREALNFWQISEPSPDLIGDLRALNES